MYFSKNEMEDGSRWVLSLSYLDGNGVLNIPSIKFYEQKDLKGKVIGEIKNGEYFINGVKKCYVAEIFKGFSVLVDFKNLGDKDTGETSLATNAKICDSFPILRDPVGGADAHYLEMRINVEGDIGSFRYKKQRLFFDVKPFLSQAGKIEKDTETILKENLSDEEMIALNKFLVEFRDFLKTATLEQLYEKVLRGRDRKDSLLHTLLFTFKTKELFMKGIKNKEKFVRDVLKRSYIGYMSMEMQRIDVSRYGRFFTVESSKVALSFEYFSGQWHLSQLIALSYLR